MMQEMQAPNPCSFGTRSSCIMAHALTKQRGEVPTQARILLNFLFCVLSSSLGKYAAPSIESIGW